MLFLIYYYRSQIVHKTAPHRERKMLEDRVEVEVKKEHIEEGEPFDPSECVIALAIQDAMPECSVKVGMRSATLTCRETFRVKRYDLDSKAQELIIDFDAGVDVSPISFEMVNFLVGDK